MLFGVVIVEVTSHLSESLITETMRVETRVGRTEEWGHSMGTLNLIKFLVCSEGEGRVTVG